jgi:hypothetical protein
VAAGVYNFTIEAGTDFSKQITWRNSAGALVNLTGYSARMHLKRQVADVLSLFTLTDANGRIALGGAAGTITLTIADADTTLLTGAYVYDLELVSGAGVVTRLLKGTITVDPEVTAA